MSKRYMYRVLECKVIHLRSSMIGPGVDIPSTRRNCGRSYRAALATANTILVLIRLRNDDAG